MFAASVNVLDIIFGIIGYDNLFSAKDVQLLIYFMCFLVVVPFYYVPSVGMYVCVTFYFVCL